MTSFSLQDIMLFASASNPIFADRQIKLDTLVRLRWLAIGGQSAAVFAVSFGLGYHFHVNYCLFLIILSIFLNLALQMGFRKSVRLPALPATGILSYDAAQLGGLLYLTGGLQNPFALLLLVPAIVSATTQPARFTAFLSILITAITTALIFFHYPLPWADATPPDFPKLYVFGIWVALIVTMLFLSIYTSRIAQEGHQLANALSATELILANEQHLTSIDGLATAAAHELGTPLATIQLVAKELERGMLRDDPIFEDVCLIRSQAERCRDILGKLRSLSGDDHSNFTKMQFEALISEIVEPFENPDIEIDRIFPQNKDNQPVLKRNPGLLFGLGNLMENAVDFAHSRVIVESQWTDSTIRLVIADDGPGFSDAIMTRLGDPFVTSRMEKSQAGRDATSGPDLARWQKSGVNGGGLGLGYFIAKTLLERSGAKVTILRSGTIKKENLSEKINEISGAVIEITWPRILLETDQ
ncbi:ActS/PrrB/RegB family redox-sensitive histidine kinase [uncultured Cohaesibacter sp.]|uniref:ActS/PrrB/RegB family redox-sensitive histidine kinase n=1 Tax=uncultured Cohaesibacter sp. TaxID=1002546 RepID=UPI0029C8926E|nr:ActS/PrrB/RegB family redox-sensitive histidine kinase [uncultured Cohaesibacter sp.]